jgi:Tol biopolymer transport system component
VPVAEHVTEFSVSAAGLLAYYELEPGLSPGGGAPPAGARRLVWHERNGARLGQIDAPPSYATPVLSPDGRSVALAAQLENRSLDIWTIDAERGTRQRLTLDDATDVSPAWSRDGARLAFTSGRKGLRLLPSALYQRAANGTGADELLFAGESSDILTPFDWSPDGHLLVFGRGRYITREQKLDLWTLETTDEHVARPLVESPSRKGPARFAPNGRWIVYRTNESGADEIVVQPFPNVGQGKWQVSIHGGLEPKWRADGRELFYLAPNADLMAVDVDTAGATFTIGTPHRLFATGIAPADLQATEIPNYFYDAAPDGERFLLSERVPTVAGTSEKNDAPVAAERPIKVIVNWTADLQR